MTTDADDAHDYEDVTIYGLDEDVEEQLLLAHNECTFIWSNKEGWPVGVIMSYVWRNGQLLADRVGPAGPDQRRAPRPTGLHRRDVHRFAAAAQQDGDVEGHVHASTTIATSRTGSTPSSPRADRPGAGRGATRSPSSSTRRGA